MLLRCLHVRFHYSICPCSDLNPANVLLGNGGEVMLTYFSEWSCINKEIPPSLVGSGYLAPEVVAGMQASETVVGVAPVVKSRSPNMAKACDWWSVGALLYELLTGTRLTDAHCDLACRQVELWLPEFVSRDAGDLLRQVGRDPPCDCVP